MVVDNCETLSKTLSLVRKISRKKPLSSGIVFIPSTTTPSISHILGASFRLFSLPSLVVLFAIIYSCLLIYLAVLIKIRLVVVWPALYDLLMTIPAYLLRLTLPLPSYL